jgi:hypothetical protein
MRRFDPFVLEVQPVSEIEWLFPQVRRAKLCALFVSGWAEREIGRLPLSAEDHPKLEQVLDFCCRLAFLMFLKTQSSVTVTSESGVVKKLALLKQKRIQASVNTHAGHSLCDCESH